MEGEFGARGVPMEKKLKKNAANWLQCEYFPGQSQRVKDVSRKQAAADSFEEKSASLSPEDLQDKSRRQQRRPKAVSLFHGCSATDNQKKKNRCSSILAMPMLHTPNRQNCQLKTMAKYQYTVLPPPSADHHLINHVKKNA